MKSFGFIVVIAVFLYISFLPVYFVERYYIFSFAVLFLVLLALKRGSIFKPADFALWLFIAALSLNVPFAQDRHIALKTYMDFAIPILCIYYLVQDGLTSEDRFRFFAKIISVTSILVCALALFEVAFAFNPIYEYWQENYFYKRYITGFVRPMSTQINPGPLGCYLLACLPFNLMLFKRDKRFFKWTGAIGIILNIVVIVLTFSRGVFAGLSAMCVFYLIAHKRYRFAMTAIVGLAIVFTACFYLPYPFSRFSVNATLGQGGLSSEYRIERFKMAVNMVKDYPLTGIGFQHFRSRFYEYYPGKYEVPWEIRIADNMYLTLLAEAGIIAFLAFLAFIFSFLRRGWKKLNTLKEPSYERWGLIASLMAFIGLLVSMIGYEFMYWPNQYLLFCIIVGCLGSFLNKETSIC